MRPIYSGSDIAPAEVAVFLAVFLGFEAHAVAVGKGCYGKLVTICQLCGETRVDIGEVVVDSRLTEFQYIREKKV